LNLCSKGAASYQLLTHESARTKMKIARRARSSGPKFRSNRDGHGGGPRLGIAQAHVVHKNEKGATINHTTAISIRRCDVG